MLHEEFFWLKKCLVIYSNICYILINDENH